MVSYYCRGLLMDWRLAATATSGIEDGILSVGRPLIRTQLFEGPKFYDLEQVECLDHYKELVEKGAEQYFYKTLRTVLLPVVPNSITHLVNMNIFRLVGDISHLLAIIILLRKIWTSRSCAGVSLKSQILFLLVFTTRYLDLVTSFVSVYNSSMKVIYLLASGATCFLIYFKFRATYDRNHDSFRFEFLIIPCVLMALVINHEFSILEVLWTYSIYQESVAILPQLYLISKTGEAESITSHYLFALGVYRGLYIFNWIYRYYAEGFYDLIAIVAGCIQTVLYCDFFYLYITKVIKGKKLVLPA